MRNVLTGLVILLLTVIVAQFFLAGGGAVEYGSGDFYDLHERLGVLPLPLALLATAVAAIVHAPRRLIALTGVAALLAVLQFVIAAISREVGGGTTGSSLVFGLHAVNGLLLMAVAGTLVRGTRMFTRAVRES